MNIAKADSLALLYILGQISYEDYQRMLAEETVS